MASLANCSSRFVLILILALFLPPSVTHSGEVGKGNPAPKKERIRVAVLPVENLSGFIGPVKEIRQVFIEKLKAAGADVLSEETLEKFMAKHRIRYTGGIDRNTAQAFKQEIDVDGVFIASLELYSEATPPKISLISRLVSTGENPSILWMDGVGLAGDDSRGFLDLKLIEDPQVLFDKAMKVMFDSLKQYVSMKADGREARPAKRKFRPKIFYRSPSLDPERKYTLAIAPVVNLSGRKYAGEIMALQLAKELKQVGHFNVMELGMIRQIFLELRIIMDQGISLAQADSVFALSNADLILSGNVTDYDDYYGVWGRPRVGFAAQLIARKGQEVVWSSESYNEGDDGVFFFDQGRVNTAHAMASQMIRSMGKIMAKWEKSWPGERLIAESSRVKAESLKLKAQSPELSRLKTESSTTGKTICYEDGEIDETTWFGAENHPGGFFSCGGNRVCR